MALTRLWFGDLLIEADTGDLPLDPFAAVLPLALAPASGSGHLMDRAPDLALRAALVERPLPSPEEHGGVPVLFHGATRCYDTADGLVLWDGGSALRIARDGRRIEAAVHPSSIARPFHFSSVTVLMALFLALRSHGRFHLHAAGAVWPDGESWLLPGESGSGKSTLALALFSAGAGFLSDDALLLRARGGELEVTGWARMIHMTARTAEAFPALGPLLARCASESARDFEVDPRIAFPERGRLAARGPFTLVFPRIASSAHSSAVPLRRAEAFGRLLHACAWVAGERVPRRDEQLAALARLVEGARAFAVDVGSRVLSDPSAAAAELRALLRRP